MKPVLTPELAAEAETIIKAARDWMIAHGHQPITDVLPAGRGLAAHFEGGVALLISVGRPGALHLDVRSGCVGPSPLEASPDRFGAWARVEDGKIIVGGKTLSRWLRIACYMVVGKVQL